MPRLRKSFTTNSPQGDGNFALHVLRESKNQLSPPIPRKGMETKTCKSNIGYAFCFFHHQFPARGWKLYSSDRENFDDLSFHHQFPARGWKQFSTNVRVSSCDFFNHQFPARGWKLFHPRSFASRKVSFHHQFPARGWKR